MRGERSLWGYRPRRSTAVTSDQGEIDRNATGSQLPTPARSPVGPTPGFEEANRGQRSAPHLAIARLRGGRVEGTVARGWPRAIIAFRSSLPLPPQSRGWRWADCAPT